MCAYVDKYIVHNKGVDMSYEVLVFLVIMALFESARLRKTINQLSDENYDLKKYKKDAAEYIALKCEENEELQLKLEELENNAKVS